MALSAFADKRQPPTENDLKRVLGKSFSAWLRLIQLVSDRIAPISQVWGFTSASTGWGLRLKCKDRVILYLTPGEGHFLVSFALGQRAIAAAQTRKLPVALLKAIDSAPRYPEGRGLRLEVRHTREVAALATLAEIKNAH